MLLCLKLNYNLTDWPNFVRNQPNPGIVIEEEVQ